MSQEEGGDKPQGFAVLLDDKASPYGSWFVGCYNDEELANGVCAKTKGRVVPIYFSPRSSVAGSESMRIIKQSALQEFFRAWRAGEPYPEEEVGSEGCAVAACSEPYTPLSSVAGNEGETPRTDSVERIYGSPKASETGDHLIVLARQLERELGRTLYGLRRHCACETDEQGDNIVKWCLMHAELRDASLSATAVHPDTARPEAAEPDGYAVVMEGGEGPFVGCYRKRQIADQACARQPAGHGDVVLPIYFARSPLAHKEKS